jgi:hypothetical protein
MACTQEFLITKKDQLVMPVSTLRVTIMRHLPPPIFNESRRLWQTKVAAVVQAVSSLKMGGDMAEITYTAAAR